MKTLTRKLAAVTRDIAEVIDRITALGSDLARMPVHKLEPPGTTTGSPRRPICSGSAMSSMPSVAR